MLTEKRKAPVAVSTPLEAMLFGRGRLALDTASSDSMEAISPDEKVNKESERI